MIEYMTEQEQIQQLKNWVKQYGMMILLGMLLAVALATGWHAWANHCKRVTVRAAIIYDNMLTQKAQNNANAIEAAHQLIARYSRTPYADMAAFLIARDAILKKDSTTAIQQFDWVIHHSKAESIREIARIREARVLIADKKAESALNILNTINDDAFIGLIDEARGDAYLLAEKTLDAKTAYQRALKELPRADVTRPILAMKLANLETL